MPVSLSTHMQHTRAHALTHAHASLSLLFSGTLPSSKFLKKYENLIFVKTYKTASTTVAMMLNGIGFQLKKTMLHPKDKGWYQDNELKSRADEGQTFGLSFRHLTPVVEYDQLTRLVPNAMMTTIVRNPNTKFVSMFNFVETTKKKFRTPEAFVDAVFSSEATQQQSDDLCNNMAYTLSGSKDSLAKLSASESSAYADSLIQRLTEVSASISLFFFFIHEFFSNLRTV